MSGKFNIIFKLEAYEILRSNCVRKYVHMCIHVICWQEYYKLK